MGNILFNQFIFQMHLDELMPSPNRFFPFAGSIIAAAAMGGVYGLIGRVVYPKEAISPFNYSIWFAIAYQIKQCVYLLEDRFKTFLNIGIYLEELEQIPEDALDLQNQIRYHCWKVIHLRTRCIHVIDGIFSKIFHIRLYHEINENNVREASFIEMTRYRIWKVFKTTMIETLSSSLAYRLVHATGFYLPAHTAVPLFIIIQSIVKNIFLIPAIHTYARLCNKLADKIGDGDKRAAAYRFHFMTHVVLAWFPL